MKKIILFSSFLIICTSCTVPSGVNTQNIKEKTNVIVSEPIPGASCTCIDTQTNCKELIKRKYSCETK